MDPFIAAVLLDLVYLERDRLAMARARADPEARPWFNRQINKLDRWGSRLEGVAAHNGWDDALAVAARRHLPQLREEEPAGAD